MALAVGSSVQGDRPVSILPSITCSGCGAEIAIAAMGDHICTPGPASPPAPTRSKSRTFSMSSLKLRKLSISGRAPTVIHPPMPQSDITPPTTTTTSRKQARLLPLNIDSEAANRLGGISAPTIPTPMSARYESRAGDRPVPGRSATTPMLSQYDNRPPSPPYSSNLDCAFPPFPTSTPTPTGRSSPSSGRMTPIGGDRAPSRSASRLDQCQTLEPGPYDMQPKSPGFQAGENVLQKLNSLQSGPFDAVRRQGSGSSKASGTDSEKRLNTPLQSSDDTMEKSTNDKKTPPPRPARTSEDVLSPEDLDELSTGPLSFIAPVPTPEQAEQHVPEDVPQEFFNEPEEFLDEPSPIETLTEVRYEAPLRFPKRKESLAANVIPEFSMPRIELSSPRDANKNGEQMDHSMEESPPAPEPTQETRYYKAHTPSESGSSATSTQHSGSSVASPPSSAASSMGTFSPLNFDLPEFADDENMHVSGLKVRNPIKPGLRAEMPARPRSPKNSPPRDAPTSNSSPREWPPRAAGTSNTSQEFPMDQRSQQSSTYERFQPLATTKSPLPPHLALSSTTSAGELSPALSPSPEFGTFGDSIPRTPSPAPTHTAGQQPSRPRTRKPNCRGCGQMIEGKSVKAADGRLTGRWHKACFVCRSCQEPFVTADFYVINNEPYCEHHYHEQNGSLCHGCNRGIEGQYLETTSSTRYGTTDRKYHPRCFTCSDCRQVLVDDYFEIQSKVYCERHALYAMRSQHRQQGPPTTGTALGPYGQSDRRQLMAERRTTRLINPMMA
ncbi:unnamed protein product [Zymoseptoria tritici ST99CH_1A5]|uniref:LIM zinc-binding domain-containing protein n=2 Tax=Zymoseptoria tritici TaxID=1047171 RepID=A0A2H1FLA0_ZYMTR|nr:unnamed protein product [Zymoseptoria tritici ST99CH_1E4]SMR44291.1 unnamed protein product [Zymoseptoria tritici ST99CH_3D1]SMY19446.1 unnamed protein product [Zymoseptoria tritici ST99CH_1A5]